VTGRLLPRILDVDLSTGRQAWRPIRAETFEAFLGGAALGAYLLQEDLQPAHDPLAPEAPMYWLAGPLTGTAGPAVGRMVLCARSPATGLWGESNIGGHIGAEMRSAGFDGLVVRGRAPRPVFLWLHDGILELRSAEHLWGRTDTYQTQQELRKELGDKLARSACIGAAGEALHPFGLVLCDHGRVAGRTGMGAVMGSKHLKAVVCRGSEAVPLAEPERYAKLRRQVNLPLREDNLSRALRQTGTAGSAEYWEYLGTLPKRYYTAGVFADVDKISGTTVAETALVRPSACHGCVIACGRVVRFGGAEEQKGAEYETTAGFGPLVGVSDAAFVTRMGGLCDRYGMDAISTSNVIGLAFLLFEQGHITTSDTEGLELRWGNMEAIEALVHKTALRQGFGSRLAQGARALASGVGHPELAAQVNGLEMPYHDPRGASGMALVYATSPRGACHNQGDYFMVDGLGHTIEEVGVDMFDRFAGAEKAANVARHQDWRSLGNALVLCIFSNVDAQDVCDLVNLSTGFDYDLAALARVGERSFNLKRMINARLGLGRGAGADVLPPILLRPLAEGGTGGHVPPLSAMLEAYYAARGWDPQSGQPEPATVSRLGLAELVKREPEQAMGGGIR
jgi:aldehyde:ferredoxin oxidoreductase